MCADPTQGTLFTPRRKGTLTCEGGGVEDDLWVEGVRVAERVSQDESPLGVGVIHLQRGVKGGGSASTGRTN